MLPYIDQFRRFLLAETIQYASKNSSFYKNLYKDIEIDKVTKVSDLYYLPTIEKTTVRSKQKQLLVLKLVAGQVQYTSGTTGNPLLIYRSLRELQFINNFYSAIVTNNFPMPIMLQIQENYHGSSTKIPGSNFVIGGSIISDSTIQQLLFLLKHKFDLVGIEESISQVTGTDSAIKLLTHYARNSRFDPNSTKVTNLITQGDLLPYPDRVSISSFWGAPVIDRYSLSEHFGGATSLAGTDAYLFDPTIIPEVLDFESGEPIYQGYGVLHLTSLYPFVQMMPLLRYNTNDFVEILETNEEYSNLLFRIKGRIQSTLFLRQSDRQVPILFPSDVVNILALHKDIFRKARRKDLHFIGAAEAGGNPTYKAECCLDQSTKTISIHLIVGVRFDPKEDIDRTEKLHKTLRKQILEVIVNKSLLERDYQILPRITFTTTPPA